MDTKTENAVIKAVKNFTPEQMETCDKDAEWENGNWTNERLARAMVKQLSYCSSEALQLAMEQSEAFELAMYDVVAAAVCNQHALDMNNYSATFDEVA